MQCCGSARCGPTIDQPQEPARGCRPEHSSACKFLNRSKPHGKTKRKDSNFVIERRAHLGPSASESVHSTGARVELPRIEGTAAPASDRICNQPTASTGQGGNLARRRYQKATGWNCHPYAAASCARHKEGTADAATSGSKAR